MELLKEAEERKKKREQKQTDEGDKFIEENFR
jgi:hypothetical protein